MEFNQEELTEKNNQIQEAKLPKFEIITSDLLKSRRAKHTKLLSGEPIDISIKKSPKVLEFDEPLFIETIVFVSSSEKKRPNIEVELFRLNGKKEKYKAVSNTNALNETFIRVRGFITGFSIKSGNVMLAEKMSKIRVRGYTVEQLGSFSEFTEDFLENFSEHKNEVKKSLDHVVKNKLILDKQQKEFRDSKAELESEIAELESNKEDSEEELEILKSGVESKSSEIKALKSDFEDLTVKNTSLSTKNQELEETKSSLASKISKLKEELNFFKRSKDLYSEDMKGFTQEGRKQLWFYYILIAICVGLIGWVGYEAADRIDGLVNKFIAVLNLGKKVEAWEMLILRVPLAALIGMAIYYVGKFAKNLMGEVIKIHTQKRELLSLSILARNVSDSSSEGLDLSDEEIYKLREQSKYEVLSRSLIAAPFKELAKSREKEIEDILKNAQFVNNSDQSSEENPEPLQ